MFILIRGPTKTECFINKIEFLFHIKLYGNTKIVYLNYAQKDYVNFNV